MTLTQVYYVERQAICETIASDKVNTGKNFGKIYWIHLTKIKTNVTREKREVTTILG